MGMASSQFDFPSLRKDFSESISKVVKSKQEVLPFIKMVQAARGSENEKKLTLDQAFRDALKNQIVQQSGCNIYTGVVSLCTDAASRGMCSPSTPFLLLGDIFDIVTLDICEEMFQFVESRVPIWKSATFYTAGKNYLLRMCNDLLRRLSQSQNTVFCGRIQLFLARLFPLDEKSGVNLISQFNTENLTVYNTRDATPQDSPKGDSTKVEKMETDEGKLDQSSSNISAPIDYNLYRKFWGLQEFFNDPKKCYSKEPWKTFTKNSDEVLAAFSSFKLDHVSSSKKTVEKKESSSHTYFAKYLTSEKLFDLQMNDSNFRRYVLLQFIIIFHYLNARVKFKSNDMVLTDEQAQWVKKTTEKVYELIKETPPDCTEFAKAVEHILGREENWNNWKNNGCPSFVRHKEKEKEEPAGKQRRARKRGLAEEMKEAGPSGKIMMGSPELTRLWNLCPDNMTACRAEERQFLPTVEEYFEDAIEQADPENKVEDEYKVVNNSNYGWRALRLLARKSPYFFQPSNQSSKSLPQYLEDMVNKIAKEMPAQADEEKTEIQDANAETDELLENQEETQEEDGDIPEEGGQRLSSAQIEAVVIKLGQNWKTVAGELNLSPQDVAQLEADYAELKSKATEMLMSWDMKEGSKATKDALVTALQNSGLQDIVDSVFAE